MKNIGKYLCTSYNYQLLSRLIGTAIQTSTYINNFMNNITKITNYFPSIRYNNHPFSGSTGIASDGLKVLDS
jgi:hypothetical protein